MLLMEEEYEYDYSCSATILCLGHPSTSWYTKGISGSQDNEISMASLHILRSNVTVCNYKSVFQARHWKDADKSWDRML